MIGTKLAHYEITDHLGTGGMGEVYQATDLKLGRSVAIKFLPEAFTHDAERASRFEREARVLASLNHPNIATIHGVEESGARKYLIMELVTGETLAERIKRGAIPIDETLRIATQIAEALEAAHDKGVIHRDLKPANIKVTDDGKVKVLDFGLAKAFAAEAAQLNMSNPPTVSMAATRAGVILGTPAYMSPEQARGEPVDRRCDIWAFGCVLFEMLTGVHAFGAATVTETLAKVLESAPALKLVPSPTPPSVKRLLRRCLEKAPRERLQHIGDARVELRDALAGPPAGIEDVAPALAASQPRTQARVWGAVALILLGASAAWFIAMRRVPEPTSGTMRLLVGSVPAPQYLPFGSRPVAIAPDGTRLAYVSGSQLWLRPLDRMDAVPIIRGNNPFFSADSKWLAFFEDGLNKIPVNAGGVVKIASFSGRALGGTWGPDGTIVFATVAGLFSASSEAEGEEPRMLAAPREEGMVYAWPRFMPDGHSVLFTAVKAGSVDAAEIRLLNLNDMKIQPVLMGGSSAQYVPGGYLVYASGRQLKAVAFDLAYGTILGEPIALPDIEITVTGDNGAAHYAVSDNGILVHMDAGRPSLNRRLVWVDPNGGMEYLNVESRAYAYPRICQNRVAVDLQGPNRDIWVLNLERGISDGGFVSLNKVSEGPTEDMLPVWSRDCQRLYYGSNRSGNFQIYSRSFDGSGTEDLLSADPNVTTPSSLAPDNRLLVSGFPTPDIGIIRLTPPHDIQWLLNSRFREANGSVSPNGNWLLYESNESGVQTEIYLRPFKNGGSRREPVSRGGGSHARWGPEGSSEIYYRNPEGDMMAVRVQLSPEPKIDAPRKLFPNDKFGAGGSWSYDVAPDGRFLMTQDVEDRQRDEVTIPIIINLTSQLKSLLPQP